MSEKNDDFVSFEKALSELNMKDEDLKKMVSEGEIRAFREGQSMKFRREDIEAMVSRRTGDDELVFADALEDDTGMVTEELDEEDTLLADDEEEEPAAPRVSVARSRTAREALQEMAETKESPLFTAVAVVTCVIGLYGLMVIYSIAAETPPGGITGFFAN